MSALVATSTTATTTTLTPSSSPSPPTPTTSTSVSSPASSVPATDGSAAVLSPLWPPAHGYPLRWFGDAIDDVFHCGCCQQCLRRPMELIPCDHLVCAACWADLTSRSGQSQVSCPICARPVTEGRVNKPIEGIISRWQIRCPYTERGCQHRCSIGREEANLLSHLDQLCPFVPLPCPHCGQLVERRSRAAHEAHGCSARMDECSHCHARIHKDDPKQRALHALNPVDPTLPCSNIRRCPNACTTPAPHTDAAPAAYSFSSPSKTPSSASSSPSSQVTSSQSSSARPGKRRREEDRKEGVEGSDEAGEASSSALSSLALPTVLPHWLMAGHLLVCPSQLLMCGVCFQTVRRAELTGHFITSHPGQAVVASESHAESKSMQKSSGGVEDERVTQQAKDERMSKLEAECAVAVKRAVGLEEELAARSSQWSSESRSLEDSIRELHKARQAEQGAIQALHEERDRLQRQLVEQQTTLQQLQAQLTAQTQSTGSTVGSHTQGQGTADHQTAAAPLARPLAPLPSPFSSAPSPPQPLPSSVPFSARLSMFESRLGALPCLYCHLPRRLLSTPGSSSPCSTHHPSERMLTMDNRYYCCGRPKGHAGCAVREKHEFDMAALSADFPDFRDRCHNIRAGTGGGTAAAHSKRPMVGAGDDEDHSMRT